MTTDNDQTPHTPDNLDDQLPPSLFAPPGRGTPPPLFGPVPPRRDAEPDPALSEGGGGGGTPPPLFRPVGDKVPAPDAVPAPAAPERGGGGSTPPPLFRPVADRTPQPDAEPVRWPGADPVRGPGAEPVRGPEGNPARGPESEPARVPGGAKTSPPGGDKAPSAPPRTIVPESPDVSLHLGPVPDRTAPDLLAPEGPAADRPASTPGRAAADGRAPASERPGAEDRGSGSGRPAPDGPAPISARPGADGPAPASARSATGGRGPVPARPAADGPARTPASPAADARGTAPGRPAADGLAPVSGRPGADGRGPVSGRPAADGRGPVPARPAADGPARTPAPPVADGGRPAPLDGNLHLKPVRRSRTEPSAEWTPHPSYGAEPESPKRESRGDAGPDTELDLVLDLAPGDRAASATFSVPAPTAAPVTATASATATAATPPNPGRRHSVIANETTASIPVHLLFRDDQASADGAAALPGPGAVVHRPAGDRAPATRRPPVPRSPQTRVRPSTRPAPVADPRLSERPGPALSGYAALLAGAAGTAGALAVLWWRGVLPAGWQSAVGLTPRPDLGIGVGAWAALALLATVVLLALGGLGRGRVGYAWVLTLFGDYRGSVRRTGLVWVSPLLLRRRVDVRLRHWRSEPLPAVDANGTALRVVVLVVWRIKDTVRAVLGIEDHEAYLSAQVEAAMARVLSQLPADAFHEDAPTLRDAEAVGDALTRMLKADCEPVGVEVYSAQPTGIEYAPEVAAAMQRRRIAAIDSKHRDSVLTSVVDAVDDTVNRLTTRGIVELDDYERKALVKDLTVAFYTGRSGGGDGA
ncbi:SPFH domain-containing protein [Streptomyces globisporus]|uniref:SPFH domain-containing protein n=1 Tax=Streptomyces globisporus TaxID=1908 RepID=UPI003824768A